MTDRPFCMYDFLADYRMGLSQGYEVRRRPLGDATEGFELWRFGARQAGPYPSFLDALGAASRASGDTFALCSHTPGRRKRDRCEGYDGVNERYAAARRS